MKSKMFLILPLLCMGGCGYQITSQTSSSSLGSTSLPADGKWDVNFMYNYEGNDSIFKTYKIEHNSKIDKKDIETPTRSGYDFTNWYKDSACKIEWDFNKDKVTAPTELYAGWSKNNNASTSYSITWTNVEGVVYESINNNNLPIEAENGETISFKVNVLDNYSGTLKVLVNNNEISATNGIYSFTVNGDVTVNVEGISKNEVVVPSTYRITFTLPNFDPAAVNPRLYYWGSETISDSIFSLGATSNMSQLSGSTYYIDLSTSISLEGLIIIFDQGNEVKQSFDITSNLPTSAGTYNINVPDWGPDGWKPNSFGVWCFVAELVRA